MADDTRDTTGPLSERQRLILKRLAEGHTHDRIGREIGISQHYVSNIISGSIRPKMRVYRTSQAVAQYSRAQGLIQAAQRLREGIMPYPGDPAEEHVNHVLESMAVEMTRMANDLLP